jgi:hypothetical protein
LKSRNPHLPSFVVRGTAVARYIAEPGIRRCRHPPRSNKPLTKWHEGQEGRAASRTPRTLPTTRPPSGYVSAAPSPSHLFGHAPEGLRGFWVAVAYEGGETGGGKGELVDRRFIVLLEVTQESAGRDPWMPARLLAGDQQRQLKRVCEPEPGEFFCGHLGTRQVAAFQRPPKDRPRVALRGRRCSSPGPRRRSESRASCGQIVG